VARDLAAEPVRGPFDALGMGITTADVGERQFVEEGENFVAFEVIGKPRPRTTRREPSDTSRL
jgi:hypothetical protein